MNKNDTQQEYQVKDLQLALFSALSRTLEENDESAEDFAKRSGIALGDVEDILLCRFNGSYTDIVNIFEKTKFKDGLQGIISAQGVERVDFCVGYFNLRGWDLIVNHIDSIPGGYVYENDEQKFRICRLLIGMQRPPEELIRALYSQEEQTPDADYVQKCKLKIAQEFRKQLLLGLPTKKRRMDSSSSFCSAKREKGMCQTISKRASPCKTIFSLSS